MKHTINDIEYNVESSNGQTEVSWHNGSYTSGHTDTQALEVVVLGHIRELRDEALRESDWRLSEDYPYDDQEQWKTYRQELRDLPSTYIHGNDIVLPTKQGET